MPIHRTVPRLPIALLLALVAGLPGADLVFNVLLSAQSAHNTTASPTYDQRHFPANFGTASWVSPTQTATIDPGRMDRSMQPVTPGHVSRADVHTLIPSRPDLRWFAHLMCWWGTGSPFDIGVDCNTDAYAAALVTDLRNRGFNGVVVCWNSPGSRDDQVARRIQSYVRTLPAGSFSFIILVDQGLVAGKADPKGALTDAVNYCKTQYFGDPNYEREAGKPILMFYGIRTGLGAAAMAEVKAATGGGMVWVSNGKEQIDEAWVDQTFGWHEAFPNGVNQADPYNLYWVKDYLDAVASRPAKQAFGAMCAGFNGTLSTWGREYLPRGSGACVVQRAQLIDRVIPRNVTRMQWVTWNDWAEGSAVEPGVENDISVTASLQGSALSWGVAGGTGDESTIDHYRIYASLDGINATDLGPVPVGTRRLELGTVAGLRPGTTYRLVVAAIGRPCIRDHLSNPVSYAIAAADAVPGITTQPQGRTVSLGQRAAFTVAASGSPAPGFQWRRNGSDIVGATGVSYTTPPTVAGDSGASFACVVANRAGAVVSDAAVLTVSTDGANQPGDGAGGGSGGNGCGLGTGAVALLGALGLKYRNR